MSSSADVGALLDRDSGALLAFLNADLTRTRAGIPIVLGRSGAASSITGTLTDTVLGSCVVPGGLLGADGILIAVAFWSHTNNANNKNLRMKYGNSTCDLMGGRMATTSATTFTQRWMFQRSVSSQVFNNATQDFLSSSNAPGTAAINSAIDQPFQFTGILANVADTITLEAWALLAVPSG